MNEVVDNSDLIQELVVRGVRQMRAVKASHTSPGLTTERLIAELAGHPEPRLREALIALFIRRPEYSALVRDLAAALEPSAGIVLRHMYTAAVYLQRMWLGTLQLYLGDFPLLPDYFGERVFGLPDPNDHFGESGLRALANRFKEKTGYEWLSAYHSAMALLLDQLRLECRSEQPIS